MSCIRGQRAIARWKIVVLYPPTVIDMKDLAILENSTISQECKYIHGYPTQTDITWWVGSKLVVLGSQLVITQVSRLSAGLYRCEATNRFEHDEMPYIGKGSGMFQLKVTYPATITRFHINALPHIVQVTLIETENATFQYLELTQLRPDILYEAQLIASFSSGNYSIAPTVTFKTLSFSEETKLSIIVAATAGSVLIMCIMSVLLRLYLKRSLRDDTHGEMSRIHPFIDPQDAHSAHIEPVPPQIIGGTNLRDEICLKTKLNPTEELHNYMGEFVEDEVEEYITGCCHSSSSTTDSVISDTCLQYLTVIDNVPIPPESIVLTSEYDDVANTSRQPQS
ncbi:hypothetical protein DPMN_160971 [Dreissena polymorpha]|uniref:Ig-like domain-containing protein n=1 Tax=Dreissena polymorpha TaxID=45954 RepID=A0A9D4EP47_DREPO|nr:hypothetical protein DPMN_160971 [Dreissena polymorpha]